MKTSNPELRTLNLEVFALRISLGVQCSMFSARCFPLF
jgi:hypothetical protein